MYSVFFDLDPLDRWHRYEVEGLLSESEKSATAVKIAASRKAADFTLGFKSVTLADPVWKILSPAQFTNDFVWDISDAPSGVQPGLYCSLPAGLYAPPCHRSFCYWLRYNETVHKFPLEAAEVTYSFVGGISSGLRARLIAGFGSHPSPRREIRVQGGPWEAIFDRSGVRTKQDYSDSLRRSKFVLCPRGNGVGSIRLFEVMEAQRVPVIISDRYVLPAGPKWAECSLRVRERELSQIDRIIEAAEPRWAQMAVAARKQWEEHFSRARILDEIGRLIAELRPGAGGFRRIRATAFKGEAMLRSSLPGRMKQLQQFLGLKNPSQPLPPT